MGHISTGTKKDCFAYVKDAHKCDALDKLYCEIGISECPFYQNRKEKRIKDEKHQEKYGYKCAVTEKKNKRFNKLLERVRKSQ